MVKQAKPKSGSWPVAVYELLALSCATPFIMQGLKFSGICRYSTTVHVDSFKTQWSIVEGVSPFHIV